MKVSYNWLRELVDVQIPPAALAEKLSLAGLEVADVRAAVPSFAGIVVGKILETRAHPDADKLQVCTVDAGQGAPLQIVCGASNARAGLLAPLAMVGGSLPDGTTIKRAKLRGVESFGMLCSSRELQLGDEHEGLLELAADAMPGTSFTDYLGGADTLIEIEITPNRGDCLGMLGVARDVGAILNVPLRHPESPSAEVTIKDAVPVALEAPEACPAFFGRVIRGLNLQASSPVWLRERLRRAGLRAINPAVDVTQYVMLALGQPLHAYDLTKIDKGIRVRFATPNEKLVLLDGQEVTLADDMLVIADKSRALGLGGIMGGQSSAVTAESNDIFLECAWFTPQAINGRPRRLGLQTDAGYRFERGVDSSMQLRALEMATRLLLDIAGGQAGPITDARAPAHLPARGTLTLRAERLAAVLGISIPAREVLGILERLGLAPKAVAGGWKIQVPAHRFDLEIEDDLIEEVGRIHGYDQIPAHQYPSAQPMRPLPESVLPLSRLRETLIQRGYQEAITYSFVAADQQRLLTGEEGIPLANPITADMTHMRRSLWPGLLATLAYNRNRQQERVRLFETGLRFIEQASEIKQENMIAGLVSGPLYPLQWGEPARNVSFADLKSDVEALLAPGGLADLAVEAAPHPALHPGQSARLLRDGQELGWLGALHPTVCKALELPHDVLVFELQLAPLLQANTPEFVPISTYPAVRRDLAVVVDENLPASALLTAARAAAPESLKDLRIFDIYRGQGVDSGRKSIALALILQESSRTLTDDDADRITAAVAARFRQEFGASLRE